MKFFRKIVDWGSNFFKSIRSDNKKQILELEKLEKKLEEQKKEVKPSYAAQMFTNRAFLKFWVIGVIIIFVGIFVYQSLSIIYLIFMAYIISLAMEAIIDFLQKKILKHRGISIFIAYFFILLVLLGAMLFVIPFFLDQISEVIMMGINNISKRQEILTNKSLVQIIEDIHRLPGSFKYGLLESFSNPDVVVGVQTQLQQNINQIINMGTSYAKNIGNAAVSAVGTFFSFITQTSIVLTLSVLFSVQKEAVMKFIAKLGGSKKYKLIYMKLERIYKKLGIRLQSQLLLCIFIGLAMYAALWILSIFGIDLPQKWALAAIAALTEFIPYIGPILWGAVATLVAFIHFGRSGALIVASVVILIQWLENNVLIPVLMNKTLGVNPVVIFISMIIWALILWFVGVLLAVPIAVIITLILEKTFEE